MYRFFVDKDLIDIPAKKVLITGDDRNHIKNVLRMKAGEEISVMECGSDDEYRCAISGYTDEAVEAELLFVKKCDSELPCAVTLFQALPKSDKMETIVMKAVELGATGIVPVATKRAVVKLDTEKAEKKVKRWNAVSTAAAKQSKRSVIPEVSSVVSFSDAIAMCKDFDVKLIPYEMSDDPMDRTKEIIGAIAPGMKVAVFIGPEGGFAPEEIDEAKEAGFSPVTLGRRILRTETAGMVALAFIMYNIEH